MSSSTSSSSTGGIGFAGALAIVFIILKLLDKIDWSWWWVLSPLWIPIPIVLLILFGVLVYIVLRKYTKWNSGRVK